MWPAYVQGKPDRPGQGTHLPEHQLSVHMHGQVSEVQEHLIGGQLLLDDIIPIDGDDGHADEQVEVVRLRGHRELRGSLPSLRQSSALSLTQATWVQVRALGNYTPHHPPLKTGPVLAATSGAAGTY